MYRCTVVDNVATGGIWSGYAGGLDNCYAENCVITGNVSTSKNATQGLHGGAGNSWLNHCTIAYNVARYDYGGTYNCRMTNCVVYGNLASTAHSNYSPFCSMTFCCTMPNPGGFNIGDDPELVAGARLGSSSPCIDATWLNTATNDRIGIARPLDGDNAGIIYPDIGAYEYVHYLADTDGDTMSDNWEIAGSLDPTVDDADEDPDGDRMSNVEEWYADTHPRSAYSYLGMTAITLTTNGYPDVEWRGGEDVTQYLERATSLLPGTEDWNAIETNTPPTLTTGNKVDSNMPPGTVYYRMRAER